jgi:rhodanese-related sulfurtransferase
MRENQNITEGEIIMSYIKELTLPLDCITKEDLLQRINEESNFVIVDTIGTYNGNKFKIKGAKTIPYLEVIDRRKELAPYEEIIIYCKHKDCVASKKVALGLKLLKVPNVKVYEGGINEWLENKLPVEDA